MASLARMLRCSRAIASLKTLASSSTHLPPTLPNRPLVHQLHISAHQGPHSRSIPGFMVPAVLAGLLGVGLLDVAAADADETSSGTALPSGSPPTPNHSFLEELAMKEKNRLGELIKTKGMLIGSYPRYTVAVKGQKVAIKFQVPPTCEIPVLITKLVSRLGLKLEDNGSGSDMILRAWDSGIAWQLMLSRPKKQSETVGNEGKGKDTNAKEDLCILFFRPVISADRAEIEFMKPGSFTDEELDTLVSILQLAGQQRTEETKPRGDAARVPSPNKTVSSLEAMGVKIFGINESNTDIGKAEISWENIAGYSHQKREIEDTILLALQSPEVYDDIARGTRCKFETNRPRAVLFEGPPGTGKTSCARVIAHQAGVPLLYVPLEVIMSKYYGESERLLGKVFSLANDLPNGAIVFLDEVDSFATARDGETHEATRRILSVLLRQIDGFEQEKKVVVVAATNRKQDLDPALISRFDAMIVFPLPDQQTRKEIGAQYAKHLTESELSEFAKATEGFSGRDIRDVCQQAERHWASKIIRGQTQRDEHCPLPPLEEYSESAMNRQRALLDLAQQKQESVLRRKPQFDFV
ncbi:PREDICTED: cell division control protein 48 isoform X2 [Ipomoea nil]|uniref:cell division control protein 48 isoform X2 n=1 Tax=Ipomoea nil TaxID=35883 RepID=UPI000901A754|nr:PREDICTED: cell division control protein 48 isoform X2 [Ipomoea nil]